jgi:hypothetical protein
MLGGSERPKRVIHCVAFRVLAQITVDGGELVAMPKVVIVKQADPFALRDSHTVIRGDRPAEIRLLNHENLWKGRSEMVCRPVRASVVNNNDLVRRTCLLQDASNAFLDVGAPVVCPYHNRVSTLGRHGLTLNGPAWEVLSHPAKRTRALRPAPLHARPSREARCASPVTH